MWSAILDWQADLTNFRGKKVSMSHGHLRTV